MFKLLRRDRSFYRRLTSLAVPILLQNLISSSLGMVDTAMVGTLGQTELAGMSLANTPFFVAMLFVFGLQSGGAVLMSQYWGKRDAETINRVLGISWYFAGMASFIFATVIFLFPTQVMGLTTNNPALIDIAARYGKIVAYSYFVNALVTVFTGSLRSCERPRFGMVVVITGMLSNVLFNWLLIFGNLGFPQLGVEGAAWGTLFARIIELLLMFGYIAFSKHKPFDLILRRLIIPGKLILKDFLKYSAPVILNETLWGFGMSIFPVVYGHMAASEDIVAAYAVAGNIDRIVAVAIFAVANATAVIIGKEIGAGATKNEVYDIGKTLGFISVLVGIASGALLISVLFAFAKPLLFPLFSLTENADRIATLMLTLMSLALCFRSFNSTMIVGILRGAGDVNFGLIFDVSTLWAYTVPLVAVFGLVLKLDILWVYVAIVSEEPIKALIGFLRFRSKKWIHNITRDMGSSASAPVAATIEQS